MKSKFIQSLSAVFLISVALFGCSTIESLFTSTNGKLTKRYQSAQEVPGYSGATGIQQLIDVKAYSFNIDPPTPAKRKTIFDFPEKTQKQLIKSLDNNTIVNDELIKGISASYSMSAAAAQTPAIDDRTTFKKRVVITIRNKSAMPADRISKLFVTLSYNSNVAAAAGVAPTFKFTNCSLLASDFETVDVGKLTYNRNSNFSSNLSAGTTATRTNKNTGSNTQTGSTESVDETTGDKTTSGSNNVNGTELSTGLENKLGGSIGFTRATSFSEEVALKQKRVKLSGNVNANSLSVYQETTSGIDLSGNVIADVEIKLDGNTVTLPVFHFSNLKTGIAYNIKTLLSVGVTNIVYPNAGADFTGSISFEGVYRKVTRRANSISESDDKAVFYSGNGIGANDIILLSHDEVTPDFWEIDFPVSPPPANDYLKISGGIFGANRVPLYFSDLDEAIQFLDWLKNRSADFVNGQIGVGSNYTLYHGRSAIAPPLTNNDIMNLYVGKMP